MRLCIPALLTLLVAQFLTGCGARSATQSPTALDPALAPVSTGQGATGQAAVLRSRWTIDLDTLRADVAPVATERTATQSELYSLSIGAFSNPKTIRITGVERGADALLVSYTTTHPFAAAANLAGTPSAGNREDLAITGRVVFLLEGTDAYFNDTVTANTRLLLDPDGYVTPGEMIDTPLFTANTFPYQLLVDEAQDNRVGLSNGGTVTGNYNPAGGGWQVAEFTEGITGYDILGQGQTSAHTIALSVEELQTAGSLTFDTVILAKYEDPRGGTTAVERRANRLPVDDVARFAYRMPHGALDVGQVLYNGESGGLISNTVSSTTLSFLVRDWDARATEAVATNLASESDVSLVSAGESGVPTCEVSVPGLGDLIETVAILDNGETGQPNDELIFEGDITNTVGAGQPSGGDTLVGLACLTDVVDITPPNEWGNFNRFNLRPDLSPIATVTEGRTFQAFTVELAPAVFEFGCTMPIPPQTSATRTLGFTPTGRITHNSYTTPPHANWQQFTFKALDSAAMSDPGRPGVVVQGRSLFSGSNSDFYRFFDVAGFQAERMSDFSATPIRQTNQIEIDSTNRILFTQVNNAYTQNTVGLKFNQSMADIRYFDWNGTLITGAPATITTAPHIPVAMTLDPEDNVYIIDRTHVIRKYVKANNYAQQTNGGYPIVLPIGAPMGSQGDAFTRNIHDFVINPHNAAFYILAQSNEQPANTGMGNGYLYRVDCDGNIPPTTPAGTVNPRRLILNNGFFNDGVADIMIDYRDSNANILPDAGDVQIVVVSHTDFGNTEPDILIFDSELRYNLSATLDFQDGDFTMPAYAPATGTLDMLQDQLFLSPEYCDACFHWYPTPSDWE